MKPLVSILVPVYGVEKYIEKCCQSLFEQSYDNIEYIFVDDCTKDKSIAILENLLEKYPNRKDSVKIVRHIQNKGLSGARNTAVDASMGDYLMHVDSDDYLDLNVVECLVKKALKENADVVLFDMRFVFLDKQHTILQQIPVKKEDCVKDTLTFKMSVCVCGGLYAARLFKETDVRFVEGLNFGEDYVVKPRILYYAHKITHCAECFYNYVQFNTSSYTLSYRSKNVDDLIKAIDVLNAFFKNRIDYNTYVESLSVAHLIVKIRLLIAICLHRKSVWDRLPMVADLYKNVNNVYFHIPLSYRLLLWLAECRLYNILYVYVKCGFRLKHLLK